MPSTGALRRSAPVDPKKRASPKLKIPPSPATSQYPLPDGVAAMPTIGAFSGRPCIDPKKCAFPNA